MIFEGTAFGAAGAFARRRETGEATIDELKAAIAKAVGQSDIEASFRDPAVLAGVGEEIMTELTGLGVSAELYRWANAGSATPKFQKFLREADDVIVAAEGEALFDLARGMGRAVAQRPPPPEVLDRAVAALFKERDGPELRTHLYEGVGEQWARYWIAMADSWMVGDGKLCPHVPDGYLAACEGAFRVETAAFGLALSETSTPSGKRFAFTTAD